MWLFKYVSYGYPWISVGVSKHGYPCGYEVGDGDGYLSTRWEMGAYLSPLPPPHWHSWCRVQSNDLKKNGIFFGVAVKFFVRTAVYNYFGKLQQAFLYCLQFVYTVKSLTKAFGIFWVEKEYFLSIVSKLGIMLDTYLW